MTMSNKSATETENENLNPMGQDDDNGDDDLEDMDKGGEALQEETASAAPNKKSKGGRGPSEIMKGLLCNFIKVANQDNNNYQVCAYCMDAYNKENAKFMDHGRMSAPIMPKAVRQREGPLRKHLEKCRYFRQHQVSLRRETQGTQGTLDLTMHRPSQEVPSIVASKSPKSPHSISVSTVTATSEAAYAVQARMPTYFQAAMNEVQVAIFFVLLIEFIINMVLGFNVVEQPSFQRLFNFLWPRTSDQLVQRTTIGERVLTERYAEAVNRWDKNIKKKQIGGHWFGMMVDGWEAIDKTHIEGVLLKVGQESFLLTAVPPGSKHHDIAVARMWEDIIDNHGKTHVQWLRYFLDNAGQCAQAQRILSL